MTEVLQGKVRAYDPSTDTASVEFVHHGIIESWMDRLPIHPAIDRSFVVHGADVTVQVPDTSRLCEAIIVGSGSGVNGVGRSGSSGAITTQTGYGFVATGGGGAGSASVTFSPAFTAVPTFSTSVDNQYPVVIGGLTTSGCTVSITGGPVNGYVYFSYQAQGH